MCAACQSAWGCCCRSSIQIRPNSTSRDSWVELENKRELELEGRKILERNWKTHLDVRSMNELKLTHENLRVGCGTDTVSELQYNSVPSIIIIIISSSSNETSSVRHHQPFCYISLQSKPPHRIWIWLHWIAIAIQWQWLALPGSESEQGHCVPKDSNGSCARL